jgi:predicted DNA-binding protein YlxM (UPF0122 family)
MDMSELKKRHINEVMDMFCLTKGDLNWAYVYYADDADKVIAELKESVKGLILDNYLKDKETRHNKYKRCLAMASKCRLRARWFGDNAFYKKEQWALQWHRRWLELAEKFKEAK